MINELGLLGKTLQEEKFTIARKIHEVRLSELPEEQRQLIPSHIEEEIIRLRVNFVNLFGEFLAIPEKREMAYELIEEWANETSEYVFKLGVPLDEALKDTTLYRTYINEVIENMVIAHDMSVKTLLAASKIIDPLLDYAVYCFSLTFVNFYTVNLDNARKAFIELSVPIVSISNDIAILPLIGDIDTERALLLMENTTKEVGRLKLSYLILDLSGVAIVDTMVAHHIFNLSSTLKLLGVKMILTGVRPEVAQTAVSLGLDFSEQITKGTLQQALSELKILS
ncbi:RsbT co-antagonist protein RsbRB [Sporosarcina sp. NCCP-2222]|uniref:STAS domain-containing protein n=1 Tax=Sporosarcina sp. NCCP-2222 TaxID=2935073 RepID=UPI0020823EC5|nr:STAS domain-containing protein [Sporosarcina sp. NCCP-2222]GKV56596.1 RsbT co-antagonist protein RsbRB [Sporosarcina sp. NCCP-2222]